MRLYFTVGKIFMEYRILIFVLAIQTIIAQDDCFCVQEFATGLKNPIAFNSPKDGSGHVFVGEQIGNIIIYNSDGTKLSEKFIDLTADIILSAEEGLLGFTFHPKFKSNQKVYIMYSVRTNKGPTSRVSEFRAFKNNRNVVDRKTERVILEVPQPTKLVLGGPLLFGTDGFLYIFLGDGGISENAQNRSELRGSVLRVDVKTKKSKRPYKIPKDNPFTKRSLKQKGLKLKDVRPEIFAYGFRNPVRADVDEGDRNTGYGRGRIFTGDVGADAFEEINIVKNGGNYAWAVKEGSECLELDSCQRLESEELPIHMYNHTDGLVVIGGHVYRGVENPNLNGYYFYADFVTAKIYRLEEKPLGSNNWENKQVLMCGADVCNNGLTNQYGTFIISFGKDFNGEIYIMTTDNPDPIAPAGKIFKLVDPRSRA